MGSDTANRLLEATKACLVADGFAALSTRKVAEKAGVPLSQIHYHFGGRQGVVLALLERENEVLLDRQRAMYGEDVPLWKRYEQACDFLEEDLASGYVRVLQEMVAAGWSDPDIAAAVRTAVDGWRTTLRGVAAEAERNLGGYGPLTAEHVADLVWLAHLGAETMLLLHGTVSDDTTIVDALRRIGELIRVAEDRRTAEVRQ